jgi:Zonular occludens toxin (Zot)
VLRNGRKVVIEQIDSTDGEFVMREIMEQIGWQAKRAFTELGNRACNALIVLDEGQDWVPQDSGEDESNIGRTIRRHMRETRKYGVGWMVIAQSAAGIHNDVLRHAHTVYFGRGLCVGADENHLKDRLGQEGYELYRQLDLQGGFFWVASGHDNNIGTETTPFALHPFGGNATEAFMNANPEIFAFVLGPHPLKW